MIYCKNMARMAGYWQLPYFLTSAVKTRVTVRFLPLRYNGQDVHNTSNKTSLLLYLFSNNYNDEKHFISLIPTMLFFLQIRHY